ncbi:MAG: hypothetical protein H7840_00710 [Alphaproteobacteria bacterium]
MVLERLDKTSGMHRILPYGYLLAPVAGLLMWLVLVYLLDYAEGYASFLSVCVAVGTALTVRPGGGDSSDGVSADASDGGDGGGDGGGD